MSIDGVNGRTSYIGTSIVNLRNQLNDLTQQLASGRVSTTYAGQGADRGFALSLRAQVSSIDAFADTATNVNTRLSVVNLALQGMSDIGKSVKSAAGTSTIVLNDNGQTSGQITAMAAFSNAVSLLNSQSGDRFLFSGRTTDTAATVPADVMLNGTGTQAGLTQLINERRQADQGVGNMAHLTVSSPPLDDDRDQSRRRRFVVRAEAGRDHFVADRRDRDAAGRRAAGADRRSRRRQSERRRQDHVQLQSARWHHRADRADRDHDKSAARRLVPDRRRHRRDDGEPAGCVDVFDPDAERHRAGRRVGDHGVRQLLQPVGNDYRQPGEQPGHGAGADHRRHAAFRHRADGFAGRELCGGRYHHGQRHTDHFRGLRCDRQPAQHHRQRSGLAGEDRFDHRDRYAVDGDRWGDCAARW